MLRTRMPLRLAMLCATFAATACTPLGAWLYDDPSFSLAQVRYRMASGGSDSVEVVITGCNRNDFELMGFGFETALLLEGREVGRASLESAYQLATRDSTRLTLVLPLQPSSGLEGHGQPVRYELVGSTTIKTPLGDRQVPMRQRGRVNRTGDLYEWSATDVIPCRPGQSTLPGDWNTNTTLPSPEQIPIVITPPGGMPLPGGSSEP